MSIRSSFLSFLGLFALLAWIGCGGPTTEDPNKNPKAAELTYYRDIKAIVDQKCVSCHGSGGIGPFALNTYDSLYQMRTLSHLRVKEKKMPPWLAEKGCNEFTNDISLSEDERNKLLKWFDLGAPAGDPKEAPKVQPLEKKQGLSRIDLKLSMPVKYTPQKHPDDYRCFVIDWPQTETTYITGFQVSPGNKAMVHHVIAYLAPPNQIKRYTDLDAKEAGEGYTCYGGPGGDAPWLGAWAPGLPGSDYPAGTGLKVAPGSKVILQIHYNTLAAKDDKTDQTSVEFKIDPKVDQEALVLPYTNFLSWTRGIGMAIPAGESSVEHSFSYDIASFAKKKLVLHSAMFHMHVLGKKGRLFIEKKDKTEACLLDIQRWDFNWQYFYAFAKPIILEPGDALGIACTWDNSPENQPIIDGQRAKPADVKWGEGTRDEMCLGVFYVTCQDLTGKPVICGL